MYGSIYEIVKRKLIKNLKLIKHVKNKWQLIDKSYKTLRVKLLKQKQQKINKKKQISKVNKK